MCTAMLCIQRGVTVLCGVGHCALEFMPLHVYRHAGGRSQRKSGVKGDSSRRSETLSLREWRQLQNLIYFERKLVHSK